jgi:small subunit ribosomal protein S13
MNLLFNKEIENKKSFFKNFKNYFGLGIYSCKQLKTIIGVSDKIAIILLISKKKIVLTHIIKNVFPLIVNKLNFYVWYNKKRLLFINSFKGNKHLFKLPVRGQRTKTNAKTVKK